MVKFLFKQSYRASIAQVKNYFGIITAIFIIAVFGGYSAITQIHSSHFSLQTLTLEFAILCTIICLTNIIGAIIAAKLCPWEIE